MRMIAFNAYSAETSRITTRSNKIRVLFKTWWERTLINRGRKYLKTIFLNLNLIKMATSMCHRLAMKLCISTKAMRNSFRVIIASFTVENRSKWVVLTYHGWESPQLNASLMVSFGVKFNRFLTNLSQQRRLILWMNSVNVARMSHKVLR